MIHFSNINVKPNGNSVVDIHKFMDSSALFTSSTSPLFYLPFSGFPSITIFNLRITTIPERVVFATQAILGSPFSRTKRGTEWPHSFFEIRYGAFKFISTIKTHFLPAIPWARTSHWAFMVARPRAIFSIITNKCLKFLTTNRARYYFISHIVLFSHNYLLTHIYEIYKDYLCEYFDAARERLERHQRQEVLPL